MNKKDKHYILEVGERGYRRLKLLGDIYRPGSLAFIQHDLKADITVCELGCGIGSMTLPIAEQVKQVVAIDNSEEQLILARRRAKESKIENVDFINADVMAWGGLDQRFDVIYSRLLLMHLAHPEDVIKKLKWLLKPGGVLLLEEPDATTFHCNRESKAFSRWDAICVASLSAADFGVKLCQLASDVGYRVIDQCVFKPSTKDRHEKTFMRLGMEEVQALLIQRGFVDETSLAELCAGLRELEEDPGVVIDMMSMHQIRCR